MGRGFGLICGLLGMDMTCLDEGFGWDEMVGLEMGLMDRRHEVWVVLWDGRVWGWIL